MSLVIAELAFSFVTVSLLLTFLLLVVWIASWWFLGKAASARRARPPRSWSVLLLALLLFAVWIASAWFLYDGHGLPGDVPLPEGAIYVSDAPIMESNCFPGLSKSVCSTYSDVGHTWLWSSHDSLAAVQQFYLNQLHPRDWRGLQQVVNSPGEKELTAFDIQTSELLYVEVMDAPIGTVRAPLEVH